ncbi:MAG TPA: site-specific DNA-methyltransferase [Acidimicrobiales bacterium]|nr:site-specific DNA-methyltransferase [Acidimicrobiales bacterium]
MTGAIVPLPDPASTRRRRPTVTSSFGVGRRESHDASGFYDRFTAPVVSPDKVIGTRRHPVDVLVAGDARAMDQVDDATVALVVTSPPYFAGKDYEVDLGQDHIPESYQDYLEMLTEVFAECVTKLEPGGRIAVNAANLGRRPYRSLSADVVDILQNRLRLLLRGEVVWVKGRGAGGSCAWGSFQRPGNPVLRDLTERIVIASKGRFDRALTPRQRHAQGRPSTATMFRDEFMEATTDIWEMAPESATRVGHPAPFPVELPQRLIDLYTYRGDLVLDPFMGSGTTAVAAVRTGRHYIGYDTDERYVAAARTRVEGEVGRLAREDAGLDRSARRACLPAVPGPADGDSQAQAVREGRKAKELALLVLRDCGFSDIRPDVRYGALGVDVSFLARDATGAEWAFDVCGGFTTTRSGLKRADTLWKALGKAAVLHQAQPEVPLVLLTTDAPTPGSAGDAALGVVLGAGKAIHDVVELLNAEDQERLRHHARQGPSPGFCRE